VRVTENLASIQCDVVIEFHAEDDLCSTADNKALRELFLKLEFVRLIDRYGLREVEADKPAEAEAPALCCTLPPADASCAIVFSKDGETAAVAWEKGVCTAAREQVKEIVESTAS